MNKFRLGVIAAVLPFILAGSLPLYAQEPLPPPPQSAPSGAPAQAAYSPEQLDQMLAPIALYPDQLLTQVLMASTYPLQIVEANRWLQDPNNANMHGDALVAALTPLPWDPSVKALVPFPQIIANLSDHLDWTQTLGVAFVNQQRDVMGRVQALRAQAMAAGKLQSTPQMTVQQQGPAIVIAPANPEIVYVPVYDPAVVYGAWAYPAYPPFFWAYPPGFVVGGFGFGIGFSMGFGVVGPLWGWASPNWGGGNVYINNAAYGRIGGSGYGGLNGNTWQHQGPLVGAGPRGFAGAHTGASGQGFASSGLAGTHAGAGGHAVSSGVVGTHAGTAGGGSATGLAGTHAGVSGRSAASTSLASTHANSGGRGSASSSLAGTRASTGGHRSSSAGLAAAHSGSGARSSGGFGARAGAGSHSSAVTSARAASHGGGGGGGGHAALHGGGGGGGHAAAHGGGGGSGGHQHR